MKTVYISAPISSRPKHVATHVFNMAESILYKKGYNVVINPLKLNHPDNSTYGEYIGVDIRELIDNADAIYFCRGWEASKGCMLEFCAGKVYGKEIMFE